MLRMNTSLAWLSIPLALGLALSGGCGKKEVVQSSGSLLGGATTTTDDEEEEKTRGMQNGDVTQGRGTGLPDSRRLPR
jgi:hypothetical protein